MILLNLFKSILAAFNEIKRINTAPSLCIVKEAPSGNEKGENYFKFDILGSKLTLKMKACDIAKNKSLLDRFSFNDKSDIVFSSGLCAYRLIDITLENGILFTISATFDDFSFVKRFSVTDISKSKELIKKLTKEEQRIIYSIVNEKKVVPINACANHSRNWGCN
jgi:hypothetical protein